MRAAKKAAKLERDTLKDSGQNVEEIEKLISRIGDLSKQSIGQCLLIYLSELNEYLHSLEISSDVISKIKNAYKVRGKLLHDGGCDEASLKESLVALSNFIPSLLTALFQDTACNNEP